MCVCAGVCWRGVCVCVLTSSWRAPHRVSSAGCGRSGWRRRARQLVQPCRCARDLQLHAAMEGRTPSTAAARVHAVRAAAVHAVAASCSYSSELLTRGVCDSPAGGGRRLAVGREPDLVLEQEQGQTRTHNPDQPARCRPPDCVFVFFAFSSNQPFRS